MELHDSKFADMGEADLKEINHELSGWTNTAAEKQILLILERASGDPRRLNYIIHRIDLSKLFTDLNDGLLFKAHTNLLELLSGALLPLLDHKSKELLCTELRRRNKDGAEQDTLDLLLVSITRASFDNADLGLAWLKANVRFHSAIQLSKDLVNKSASLATDNAGGNEAAESTVTNLKEVLLAHLPHKGVGVRLEDIGGIFNEFLELLGLDTSFRSRLDLAGHAKQYPDAVAFLTEVIDGLRMNPIVAAFLAEWEQQPSAFKARTFPPPSHERDHWVTRAIVYCFFIDVMTHSMMFEQPADVAPELKGETVMETVTRVSTTHLLSSDWWRYLNFWEHTQMAAWDIAWERDFVPYKRSCFPATRIAEHTHKAELIRASVFELAFNSLLRGSDEAAQSAFALVQGVMNKGPGAAPIPGLGNTLWSESSLEPCPPRGKSGTPCRMGFGGEAEALSPVWENLFVSCWLEYCATEPDGIMQIACSLAPLAGSFYRKKEGLGHFLNFRTPTQWLHQRMRAMARVARRQRDPVVDSRSPQCGILWSKVNAEAAKHYLNRLDAIILRQPTKVAAGLKATAAANQVVWTKLQAAAKKYLDFDLACQGGQPRATLERIVSGGRVRVMDSFERTTRLFWQTLGPTCSINSVVLPYEKTLFRSAARKFVGATTKVHTYETEEKDLVVRVGGLIDPGEYNRRLIARGTPLFEDLLFDRNSVRTKALCNNQRVGTLLIYVHSVTLKETRKSEMYCLMETTLSPRDGFWQGSVKTAPSTGVWNESFLLPLSARPLENGSAFTLELWEKGEMYDTLLGHCNFSLPVLKTMEIAAFPLEGNPQPFTHPLSGIEGGYSPGTLEVGIMFVSAKNDPLSDYVHRRVLPDKVARSAWPANRSFGRIPEGELLIIRETMEVLGPTMKTGDLILWGSSLQKGDLPTRLMNTMMNDITKSIYTHCAIVFVAENPISKERRVFHVEAGVNRLLDDDQIAKTAFRNSIFCTDLGERIENFGATMVYLPLLNPLSEAQHQTISRFLAHMWLRDPLFDSAQLVTAGLQRSVSLKALENHEDWSRLFCSELCSAAYKLAALPGCSDLNTSNVPPAEVGALPIFSKQRFVLKVIKEHLENDESIVRDFQATLVCVQERRKAPQERSKSPVRSRSPQRARSQSPTREGKKE